MDQELTQEPAASSAAHVPPSEAAANVVTEAVTEAPADVAADSAAKTVADTVADKATDVLPNTDIPEIASDTIVSLREQLLPFWSEGSDFVLSLGHTWRLYQVGIIVLIAIASWGIGYLLTPKIDNWLRAQEGWSKRKLRYGIRIRRRVPMLLFVILLWLVASVMREITWPSRSYLIGAAGTLAMAWLAVGFSASLVENRVLRGMTKWGLLIYVTLYYIGLTDEFSQVLDNISISAGDIRISVLDIIRAVVVSAALLAMARSFSRGSADKIRGNSDISPSMQVLAVKFVQLSFYGVAFFMGLKVIGVDLTGFAFLSGAIGLGLGFGLQKVVSNLVSGVIILLDKSIKPGDVISLGETFGWIEQLGARYVSVVTRDGREYLIPNEDLITGQVVNWSHTNSFVRLDIYFGVAYKDDPHKVRKIAIEAASSVKRVLPLRPPVCHIVEFGDSSLNYILRFWIDDPTGGLTNIRGNVYLALWDAFQEHNISIPYPQREVRLLGDSNTETMDAALE